MTSGNLDNLDGFDDDINLAAELALIDKRIRASARKGDCEEVEKQLKTRLEKIKKPYSEFCQARVRYRNALAVASGRDRKTLESLGQKLEATDMIYNKMFEAHREYAQEWLDRAGAVSHLRESGEDYI